MAHPLLNRTASAVRKLLTNTNLPKKQLNAVTNHYNEIDVTVLDDGAVTGAEPTEWPSSRGKGCFTVGVCSAGSSDPAEEVVRWFLNGVVPPQNGSCS